MSRHARVERPSEAQLLAIFAAACATHLPAVWNRFALDDAAIMAHPAIASLHTLPKALASPWWSDNGHLYRPLTLATFAVERAIAGSGPLSYHIVNLVLHGVVSVMVAVLLARFLRPAAALAGASFFAVMPAHVEAIASVVGRAELLSAVFLVALLLLATSETAPTPVRRFMAILLAGAALASKEGGVVAPALVFATAYATPHQRRYAAEWTMAAAMGTVTLLMARLAVLGTLGGDLSHPAFRVEGAMERLGTALSMLPRTAGMLIVPVHPTIEYAPTLAALRHPSGVMLLAGALLVAMMLAAMLFNLKHPSNAGLAVWIIAVSALPTANLLFPTGVVSSGRTLYLPAVGVALLVGTLAARCMELRHPRVAFFAFGVAMLIAARVSWTESHVWESTESVLAAMRVRHPESYRTYALVAYMQRDSGHDARSLAEFQAAAARFPGDPGMLTDAATVALRVRDTATARVWLQQAVDANPRASRGRTRLASLLLAQHDSAGAITLLRAGLAVDGSQRVWREKLGELMAPAR